MLFGADHVRDLHVVIVDHAGQVVQARAVGPLDDVVLLAGPIELDLAADQVVDDQLALAGHLQPHDGLAPFGLEPAACFGVLGHPAAAVDELHACLLGPPRVRPGSPPVVA